LTPQHIFTLALFSIALALYKSIPFLSGFVLAFALMAALGIDDDDNDPPGPGRKQPT